MYIWYWIKWFTIIILEGLLVLFTFLIGPVMTVAVLLGYYPMMNDIGVFVVAEGFLIISFVVFGYHWLGYLGVPWFNMLGSDSWKEYVRVKASEKLYGKRLRDDKEEEEILLDYVCGINKIKKALRIKFTSLSKDSKVTAIEESLDGDLVYTIETLIIKGSRSRFRHIQRLEEKCPGLIVRPITISEYADWLIEYEKKRGKITHEYDYPMTEVASSWFVAEDDFSLTQSHRPRSLNIIVPIGIRYLGRTEDLGNVALYFEDNYTILGKSSVIPSYSDVDDLMNNVRIKRQDVR